jgi:hypothetical protein
MKFKVSHMWSIALLFFFQLKMVVWPKHVADNLNKLVNNYWNRVMLHGNLWTWSNARNRMQTPKFKMAFLLWGQPRQWPLSPNGRITLKYAVWAGLADNETSVLQSCNCTVLYLKWWWKEISLLGHRTCSKLNLNWRLGWACCIHLQSRRVNRVRYQRVWDRNWYVSPKRQLTLTGLRVVIFQKTEAHLYYETLHTKRRKYITYWVIADWCSPFIPVNSSTHISELFFFSKSFRLFVASYYQF